MPPLEPPEGEWSCPHLLLDSGLLSCGRTHFCYWKPLAYGPRSHVLEAKCDSQQRKMGRQSWAAQGPSVAAASQGGLQLRSTAAARCVTVSTGTHRVLCPHGSWTKNPGVVLSVCSLPSSVQSAVSRKMYQVDQMWLRGPPGKCPQRMEGFPVSQTHGTRTTTADRVMCKCSVYLNMVGPASFFKNSPYRLGENIWK